MHRKPKEGKEIKFTSLEDNTPIIVDVTERIEVEDKASDVNIDTITIVSQQEKTKKI
jgi:hypothetical protein